MPTDAQRLLLVHAHPDDEVLTTGGTMAKTVAGGGHVTLVTCTLGEEGEILLPDIAHLAADQTDDLGTHRIDELAASMAALGVTDSRLLGGAGTYRDSGMMGTPANDKPGAFWHADLREAAEHLVPIIREVRPQVMLTYDDFGGYGHPDHIQAHRVATYGAALAAVPSYRHDLGEAWDIPRIFWTAFPKGAVRLGIQALKDMGDESEFAAMDPDDIPFAIEDDDIDVRVDVTDQLDRKVAAMRAHASQISMENGFFALSNNLGAPVFGAEFFRLAKGALPERQSPDQQGDDLFVGLG